jgi:Fe-S-cluster containining protein
MRDNSVVEPVETTVCGDKPFYDQGLRFECQCCSACCRGEPGYVFFSPEDEAALCQATNLTQQQFRTVYCRRVNLGWGEHPLSLKEKANNDCIFWKDGTGCEVYEARPRQCRTWPFWPGNLFSEESWQRTAADCPGIGKGRLYSREEIDAILALPEP